MARLGGLLAFFGFGSAVLYLLDRHFTILMWLDPWQPFAGLIGGGVGAVLLMVMVLRGNDEATPEGGQPAPQGAYGPPQGYPQQGYPPPPGSPAGGFPAPGGPGGYPQGGPGSPAGGFPAQGPPAAGYPAPGGYPPPGAPPYGSIPQQGQGPQFGPRSPQGPPAQRGPQEPGDFGPQGGPPQRPRG